MDLTAPHSISEAIRLSTTPVFLLVAIGSLLNVMTSRLGRIIDRARHLEQMLVDQPQHEERERWLDELTTLDKRMTYCHWAVNFCTFSALMIAFTVALLFYTDLAGITATRAITGLFVTVMSAITLGLCAFLVEIYIAAATVRVRSDFIKTVHQKKPYSKD